jgi:acetolactate synthase-1/2/3 large subunit
MGFGLPAAIGAAVGRPDKEVVLVTGDGSFLMNIQELVTARETGVNITVLVMNDSRLGMIQQLQDYFYEGRFDVSKFETDIRFDRIAEDFGCSGIRVESSDQLAKALNEASRNERITVIDCVLGEEEHVYPMVTGSNLLELVEGGAQ